MYHDTYVSKMNEKLLEDIKTNNIEFSNVISYDEQYVLTNKGWKPKLMALDPKTKFIYDYLIVDPEDFDVECALNFLKPLVEEHNIKYLSGDGSKLNKKVSELLNLLLCLCNFHKMQNLMDLINGTKRYLNKSNKREESKIEKRKEKIIEIEELRKGKKGRIKKDDIKAKRLINKKK